MEGTEGTDIFHHTFLVYYSKKRKKYKSMTHTKIKFDIILILKIFPGMNNKNFTNRGPQGVPLLFLYKVSVVVLIYFIAILLTPGIFLIQIVNTNNTNMYLIHFHSKNIIKKCFHKNRVFKFKISSGIHYTSQSNEINCVGFSKDLRKTYHFPIFF